MSTQEYLTKTEFGEKFDELLITVKDGFDSVHEQIKSEISSVKSEVSSVRTELKSEIASIKSQMVTKDYLDEKMADLRGDLVVLVRKEDTKVKALIETLREKKILNDADVKKISSMEPFAQFSV
ncbi:MAG: hypothetical protein AAB731_00410 [Patescibacteria group bacterium]